MAVISAGLAGPAAADAITCDLAGTPVAFTIDRAQFAPPLDANEPVQRRVTTVRMGDAQFPAEPILLGGMRGFWAEGEGGGELVLMVQPDGSAVMANAQDGLRLEGRCEVTE